MSLLKHLIDAPTFADELDKASESWSSLSASSLRERVELYLLERMVSLTTDFFRTGSQKRKEYFTPSSNEGFSFGNRTYVIELSSHRPSLMIEVRSVETIKG